MGASVVARLARRGVVVDAHAVAPRRSAAERRAQRAPPRRPDHGGRQARARRSNLVGAGQRATQRGAAGARPRGDRPRRRAHGAHARGAERQRRLLPPAIAFGGRSEGHQSSQPDRRGDRRCRRPPTAEPHAAARRRRRRAPSRPNDATAAADAACRVRARGVGGVRGRRGAS